MPKRFEEVIKDGVRNLVEKLNTADVTDLPVMVSRVAHIGVDENLLFTYYNHLFICDEKLALRVFIYSDGNIVAKLLKTIDVEQPEKYVNPVVHEMVEELMNIARNIFVHDIPTCTKFDNIFGKLYIVLERCELYYYMIGTNRMYYNISYLIFDPNYMEWTPVQQIEVTRDVFGRRASINISYLLFSDKTITYDYEDREYVDWEAEVNSRVYDRLRMFFGVEKPYNVALIINRMLKQIDNRYIIEYYRKFIEYVRYASYMLI